MTDNGVRYLASRYMWINNSDKALQFDTENDAYAWAEENGIDDYAIEKR